MMLALKPSALASSWLKAAFVGTMVPFFCLKDRILAHQTDGKSAGDVMADEEVGTTGDLTLVEIVHPHVRCAMETHRCAADAVERAWLWRKDVLGQDGLSGQQQQH